MALEWNAKGDTTSTIIMWVGSILAVILAVTWLSRNLSDDTSKIDRLDSELDLFQEMIGSACNIDYYKRRYNPKLEEGHLILSGDNICIDTNPCTPLYFTPPGSASTINGNIIVKNSTRCELPMDCKSLYYDSANLPYSDSGNIIIEDATLCPGRSLRRCRITLCNTGIYDIIDLSELTYITVEKSDGFVLKAE